MVTVPVHSVIRRTVGTLVCLLLAACGGQSPPAPKVLVIGLDGATFKLLDPWMEAGKLPNLKALRDGGVSGPLLSVIPALSPPAWTTAVTGVNPGAHGIYDFLRLDPDSMVAYTETAASRRVPAIWTLLSEAGRRVGVVNVPMSDPPDPVNGFMVSGLPHTDDDGYTFPADLEGQLEEDGYRLDRMGEALIEGQEEVLRSEIVDTFRARRRAALALGEQHPDLDLYWVVFTGTDRIQHFFWKFMETEHPFHDPVLAETLGDAIESLWLEIDAAVGELVAQARAQAVASGRELAVVVLSDHGFTGIHRAFRPQSFLKQAPDGGEQVTDAYSLETNASMVYLPVVGREASATRTLEEQDRILDDILQRFQAVTDPEGGDSPILFGARREDIFHGRYVGKAPDLLFIPRPPYYMVDEVGDKEPFGTPAFTFNGHHAMDGVLIAAGPMFRRGTLEGKQSLLDITPTLLLLTGDIIPGYMEGEALVGILSPEYLLQHPLRRDTRDAVDTGRDDVDPVKAIPYLN